MKILLIRHGESTGNRDHLWAGITDNELTNHGFLQATRLGAYLAKHLEQQVNQHAVLGIYCSDLTRARRTASEIATALKSELTVTHLLREQDLGWREGRAIKDGDKTSPANADAMAKNPGESKSDMDGRACLFISQYLSPRIGEQDSTANEDAGPVIIVVSHGLFLLRLYYQLTAHLKVANPPPVSWSNTGCTTLRVAPDGTTTVTDVNSVQHLQGLKRTRAGVGSSQYDTKQQKVSDFFGAHQRRTSAQSTEMKVKQKCEMIQVPKSSGSESLQDMHDDMSLEEQIRAIDEACRHGAQQ